MESVLSYLGSLLLLSKLEGSILLRRLLYNMPSEEVFDLRRLARLHRCRARARKLLRRLHLLRLLRELVQAPSNFSHRVLLRIYAIVLSREIHR